MRLHCEEAILNILGNPYAVGIVSDMQLHVISFFLNIGTNVVHVCLMARAHAVLFHTPSPNLVSKCFIAKRNLDAKCSYCSIICTSATHKKRIMHPARF